MSTHNIHFHVRNFPKISLKVCFLELLEKFTRDSKAFESAMVNRPLVFKSFKLYCIRIQSLSKVLLMSASTCIFVEN